MKSVIIVFIFSAFLVLLLASATATAAKPQEVERVVELMYRSKKGVKKHQEGFLQVVFATMGRVYTLQYFTAERRSQPSLSVWVRPKGTRGQEALDTFSDNGLDGRVDFGIGGGKNRREFMLEPTLKGSEHREHWQGLFDQAIKDALRALGE